MKKVLFIGMPFSIHTVRWINQAIQPGVQAALFPSMKYMDLNPGLSEEIIYYSDRYTVSNIRELKGRPVSPIRPVSGSLYFRNPLFNRFFGSFMRKLGLDKSLKEDLVEVLESLKPDIVHTFESQHAGYLLSSVWDEIDYKPLWFHSLWGSDLYFFGGLPEHEERIRKMLSRVSKLIVEGQRDIDLASGLGYTNSIECIQATGGISEKEIPAFTDQPSARTTILLRGTQDMVRRGLTGLRALERCKEAWSGLELHIYDVSDVVESAAKRFEKSSGYKIILHGRMSREDFLALLRKSRIHISVSASDGMPNTMLEAMASGCFPVQSFHSCASDIISDGNNGLLIPSDDSDVIAEALVKALADKDLIDKAAQANRALILSRYDFEECKNKINSLYNVPIE